MTSMSRLAAAVSRPCAALVLGGALAGVAPGATLRFDAPLHVRPDEASAVVATLPAGSSVAPVPREEFAAAGVTELPPGWVAFRHAGTFQGYVAGTAAGDTSTVPAGTEIRAAADAAAPVLHRVAADEQITAGPPVDGWAPVSFQGELLVYANAVPPESRRRTAEVPAAAEPPSSSAAATTGEPAAEASAADRGRARQRDEETKPAPTLSNAPPRTFTGFLTRTRRWFGRGPAYPYQLVDNRNRRIALLDLSGLLLTAPLDGFEGKWVNVYGPGMNVPDVTDVVIHVETLRLAR